MQYRCGVDRYQGPPRDGRVLRGAGRPEANAGFSGDAQGKAVGGLLSYTKSALRMGSFRMRLPVAAKTALAMAGAMPGVLASPIPPGASVLGTMCTSTCGISSIRTTSWVSKL